MYNFSFFSKSAGLLLSLFALALSSGCRSTVTAFPENVDDFTGHTIVSGRFVGGKYLEQPSYCNNPPDDNGMVTLCMDAYFVLRFRVDEVMYGAPPPDRVIDVFSWDHYGLESYRRRYRQDVLMLLVSDGKSFIMPRNAGSTFRRDRRGRLITAVWNDENIGWLPCVESSQRVELDASSVPAGWGYPLDEEDPEYLAEIQGMYFVEEGMYYPKYAIPLALIQTKLSAMSPSDIEAGCFSSEE